MKDFIELIIDNAKNYPERIAVIDSDRKISYGEFLILVNSISHQLITGSLKPKILFDLKQSAKAYALIVAVLNVGGTYCPLNPDAPIERKMQIINEFAPDIIVAETEENISQFNSEKAVTIKELLVKNNYASIKKEYDGEDIIYVIYTSGWPRC